MTIKNWKKTINNKSYEKWENFKTGTTLTIQGDGSVYAKAKGQLDDWLVGGNSRKHISPSKSIIKEYGLIKTTKVEARKIAMDYMRWNSIIQHKR